MLVKIILRIPGKHTEIAKMKGDSIVFNDIAREVIHVSWDLTENSVSVLVRG